jgi:two-component system nitrogen regulation response regulator GlnG
MNAQPLRVWLVDDDASIRWVLERALKNGGMVPKTFDAAEPALDALRSDVPDVLLTDIRMPGQSGLEMLRKIHVSRPQLPVIVMTAHSDLGNAVSAYEKRRVRIPAEAVRHRPGGRSRARAAQSGVKAANDAATPARIPELLGHAPAMQQVFRAIGRLSRSSVTVLITGESGTGKELVARALHEHSPRAAQAVHRAQHLGDPVGAARVRAVRPREGCVHRRRLAAPRPLRAGRRRHAVPRRDRRHVDAAADAPAARARRRRVLPRRRPDADQGRRARDRRHAPASRGARAKGLFREDLFHRLNVIRIELPPLRARREDIGGLLEHYLGVAGAGARRRAQGARPMRAPRSRPMTGPATSASS